MDNNCLPSSLFQMSDQKVLLLVGNADLWKGPSLESQVGWMVSSLFVLPFLMGVGALVGLPWEPACGSGLDSSVMQCLPSSGHEVCTCSELWLFSE